MLWSLLLLWRVKVLQIFFVNLILLNWSEAILFAVKPQPVSKQLHVRQLPTVYNLLNFIISQAKQHILRLEVSVDDTADSIQKIQAHHYLPRDFFNQIERKSFVVISLENFKEVDP